MHFDEPTLSLLSVAQLRTLLRGQLEVPRAERVRKAPLISWTLAHADEQLQEVILAACEERRAAIEAHQRGTKRRRTKGRQNRRQARRVEYLDDDEGHDSARYLDLPSEEQLLHCYREFIEATSNTALQHAV